MHCIRTLAKLEEQRELATQALRPPTKAEREKIDADAMAHTQRQWDAYEAERNQLGAAPLVIGAAAIAFALGDN